MITSLLAFAIFSQTPAEYSPKGPVIQFTVEGRGKFEITTDPKNSPKTAEGIAKLVRSRFYDGLRVHRVEPWVTQFGAKTSRNIPKDVAKWEDTGSGKTLPFEMCEVDFVRGVVGIASMGLQLGGDSHLFIIKKDALRLYHSYAVLGKVTKGMDVVEKIRRWDKITRAVVKK